LRGGLVGRARPISFERMGNSSQTHAKNAPVFSPTFLRSKNVRGLSVGGGGAARPAAARAQINSPTRTSAKTGKKKKKKQNPGPIEKKKKKKKTNAARGIHGKPVTLFPPHKSCQRGPKFHRRHIHFGGPPQKLALCQKTKTFFKGQAVGNLDFFTAAAEKAKGDCFDDPNTVTGRGFCGKKSVGGPNTRRVWMGGGRRAKGGKHLKFACVHRSLGNSRRFFFFFLHGGFANWEIPGALGGEKGFFWRGPFVKFFSSFFYQ